MPEVPGAVVDLVPSDASVGAIAGATPGVEIQGTHARVVGAPVYGAPILGHKKHGQARNVLEGTRSVFPFRVKERAFIVEISFLAGSEVRCR